MLFERVRMTMTGENAARKEALSKLKGEREAEADRRRLRRRPQLGAEVTELLDLFEDPNVDPPAPEPDEPQAESGPEATPPKRQRNQRLSPEAGAMTTTRTSRSASPSRRPRVPTT